MNPNIGLVAGSAEDRPPAHLRFPLYAKEVNALDSEAEVYWHRVEVNMRRTSICATTHKTTVGNTVKFEIEVESSQDPLGSMDFLLEDEYACTPGEFNQALSEAIAFAKSLIGDPINE